MTKVEVASKDASEVCDVINSFMCLDHRVIATIPVRAGDPDLNIVIRENAAGVVVVSVENEDSISAVIEIGDYDHVMWSELTEAEKARW
jgi:nucleoside-triphosphatase THEP1